MAAIAPAAAVGIVGAGTMGRGIAEVALWAGHVVHLLDREPAAVDAAIDAVRMRLERAVAKGRLDAAGPLLERLRPARSLADLAPARLVVEAVVEDVDVKCGLLREAERSAPDAILASNTSSCSITALGAALDDPGRLVGLHFFNPAPVMRLVEVVAGLATRPGVVATAKATAEAWGKVAVVCRSTPGFVVNRLARPFYGEALRLLEEQATDPATLDALLVEGGGFRMGPCALMDLIGHDVNLAVTRSVWAAFGHDPRYRPSLLQRELVDAGRLGRKSGQGFFDHRDGTVPATVATFAACPPPPLVTLVGEAPVLAPLARAAEARGVEVRRDPAAAGSGIRLPDGGWLEPTRGRLATDRARDVDAPVILVDLAMDDAAPRRLALAPADATPPATLAAAVGFCQATGAQVSVIDDVPGMVVMRTVAMLANEAADALLQQLASAHDLDLAMRCGVNYPLGPLAWADRVGAARLVAVLDALDDVYRCGRYRASPLLRRHALTHRRFVA